MAGISVYPDGQYNHGATWYNSSDRVAWQRTFATGPGEAREMAMAMITANPETSSDEIRANMTAPLYTENFGYANNSAPTIDEVLNVGPQGYNPGHLRDRAPTDFSGTPAGMESNSVPSLGG